MDTDDKKFARGGKRAKAIEIMAKFNTEFPDGHKFEDCTKEIRENLQIPEGSARSYYTYIVKNKLIQGFKEAKPSERKPREVKPKNEVPAAPETDPPMSTTSTAATKDRLATIKAIAQKRTSKKKVDTPTGTPEEEALKAVLENA